MTAIYFKKYSINMFMFLFWLNNTLFNYDTIKSDIDAATKQSPAFWSRLILTEIESKFNKKK